MKLKLVIISLFCSALLSAQTENLDSVFAARVAEEQLTDSTDEQRCAYYFSEGVRYRLENKFDSSLTCFAQSISLCDDAASYYEFACIALSADRTDTIALTYGLYYLDEAIKRAPENVDYLVTKGKVCIGFGNFHEAAKIYEKILKLRPQNEFYMNTMAAIYEELGQYKKQLKVLRRQEAKSGISDDNSFEQINALVAMRRYGDAQKQCQKLIDKFPFDSEYQVTMGDIYAAEGKNDKAREIYYQVLAKDSLDMFALTSMASLCYSHGDTIGGDDYMLKTIASPNSPLKVKLDFIYAKINTLLLVGDTAKIDEIVGLVMKTYPDDEAARLLYSGYVYSVGRTSEYESSLRSVLEVNPKNEKVWDQLLSLYADSADASFAIINEALTQLPKSLQWRLYRAVFLVDKHDFVGAMADIDTAFALELTDEQKAYVYRVRGQLEASIGLYASAVADYENALQLGCSDESIFNDYAYLLASAGVDLPKAEKMISLVVQSNAENPFYLDTYAWVLFMRGDYRGARFWIERALQKENGQQPECYEHYGDILSMLGEPDAAVEQWQKAVSLGSNNSRQILMKIADKKYIPNLIELVDNEYVTTNTK